MIEVVFDNILHVDGRFMDASYGPERLRQVLAEGNFLIRAAIDETYHRYRRAAPEVQRASVWVMGLALNREDVITPEGLEADSRSQVNRGVFQDDRVITPIYMPFWSSVKLSGFFPEVRTNSHPRLEKIGAYLLVRDSPLES